MKQLVLFDFDGTLTRSDTFVEFIRFLQPPAKWLRYLQVMPFVAGHLLRVLQPVRSKAKILHVFTRGYSRLALAEKAAAFVGHLFATDRFFPGMLARLEQYRDAGAVVAVVSASPDLWVAAFCERMGVQAISTGLCYENDLYCGRFGTPNCNGEEKCARIRAAFDLAAFDEVIAFGNSSGDGPMLALASQGYLVNKDGEAKLIGGAGA